MAEIHQLHVEADDGDEVLFACHQPGCARRVVVKRSGGLTVVQQGDFYAHHVGGSGPFRFSVTVHQ